MSFPNFYITSELIKGSLLRYSILSLRKLKPKESIFLDNSISFLVADPGGS